MPTKPEPAVLHTAQGDLHALIHHPDADAASTRTASAEGLRPGIVLVDGSGDGTADGWGRWPDAIAACGAVVLSHDKPGCGDSPGDWRTQDFDDRAAESLAALELLRKQPGVDPERVGLLGISQGGWICQQAAAVGGAAVAFIVTISGPGETALQQERHRIGEALEHDAEAMAWVDERARRLVAGEAPERILADQLLYADRPWFTTATEYAYETADLLAFAGRIARFDPAEVLPRVHCPVFAAFGGADDMVPVHSSVAVYAQRLPQDPRHALVVYSRADHNLFVEARDEHVPLAGQLAPGFFPMLADWLATAI
ncbi:alpha/beta hydrolase [Actinospica durhamensis]|uniref:Alpha/beta hydrolase n=1 Tax=Actinospica durhamensis TaxID=1508375 RepID=A0A941ET23_9ACTN|nr:alpha/beta hydrolase [Actinospica durhamensis]MBR7833329.1 alpha/beta hydrolase [Actinospica durhamensis]